MKMLLSPLVSKKRKCSAKIIYGQMVTNFNSLKSFQVEGGEGFSLFSYGLFNKDNVMRNMGQIYGMKKRKNKSKSNIVVICP